jgi:hypothetical protein
MIFWGPKTVPQALSDKKSNIIQKNKKKVSDVVLNNIFSLYLIFL